MQLQATELKQGSWFSSGRCAGENRLFFCKLSASVSISWYAASTFHSSTVAGNLPGLKRKRKTLEPGKGRKDGFAEVQLQVRHELHRQTCSLKERRQSSPGSLPIRHITFQAFRALDGSEDGEACERRLTTSKSIGFSFSRFANFSSLVGKTLSCRHSYPRRRHRNFLMKTAEPKQTPLQVQLKADVWTGMSFLSLLLAFCVESLLQEIVLDFELMVAEPEFMKARRH